MQNVLEFIAFAFQLWRALEKSWLRILNHHQVFVTLSHEDDFSSVSSTIVQNTDHKIGSALVLHDI